MEFLRTTADVMAMARVLGVVFLFDNIMFSPYSLMPFLNRLANSLYGSTARRVRSRNRVAAGLRRVDRRSIYFIDRAGALIGQGEPAERVASLEGIVLALPKASTVNYLRRRVKRFRPLASPSTKLNYSKRSREIDSSFFRRSLFSQMILLNPC